MNTHGVLFYRKAIRDFFFLLSEVTFQAPLRAMLLAAYRNTEQSLLSVIV